MTRAKRTVDANGNMIACDCGHSPCPMRELDELKSAVVRYLRAEGEDVDSDIDLAEHLNGLAGIMESDKQMGYIDDEEDQR